MLACEEFTKLVDCGSESDRSTSTSLPFLVTFAAMRMSRAAMAVIVEKRLAVEDAVLPGRDDRARLLLRRVEDRLDRGFDDGRAEFAEQFRHAPLAEMRRAQHRGEIAAKFAGVADVERQQVEQIVAQLAGLVELDRRDAQPLLPDLGGRGIIGAMGARRRYRSDARARWSRADACRRRIPARSGQIGQMAAAMIGIVEQDDVAGLDVLEPLLDRERRPGQRADMNRQVIGLRDQAGVGVADRQRKIAAGIEDLRIGGAKHGLAHLLHDRTEAVLDDGARDGIDLGGHSYPFFCSCVNSVPATSSSAPDAASMIAWISASVIGVDNAINPLPAASTPRLRNARLKTA